MKKSLSAGLVLAPSLVWFAIAGSTSPPPYLISQLSMLYTYMKMLYMYMMMYTYVMLYTYRMMYTYMVLYTVDAVYMCDAVYVYAVVVCDRRQYLPGPASYMKRELN